MKPQDLRVGDEFVATSGPYRGFRVRVLDDPQPGVGGTYNVTCRILQRVRVNIDYKTELEVTRGNSLPN